MLLVHDADAGGADKFGVRGDIFPEKRINLGDAHGHEGKEHGNTEGVVLRRGDEPLDLIRLQPDGSGLFAIPAVDGEIPRDGHTVDREDRLDKIERVFNGFPRLRCQRIIERLLKVVCGYGGDLLLHKAWKTIFLDRTIRAEGRG